MEIKVKLPPSRFRTRIPASSTRAVSPVVRARPDAEAREVNVSAHSRCMAAVFPAAWPGLVCQTLA
jgi:hypothetical protein